MSDRPVIRTLKAVEWVRAMNPGPESGGSEPHQFRCDDGLAYMVKASNNPQKGRVLLNEAIGGLALDWLGVHHPAPAIVDLPAELLAASPGAKFGNGETLAAGLSYGSEYIHSEPQGTVPADQLMNLSDIAGTMVFDTWIKNGDGRQYRLCATKDDPRKYEFLPVDQGHSMAHDWTADAIKQQCGAQQVSLAPEIRSLNGSDVRPYIDRLKTFDEATADHIISQVPGAWFKGDDERTAVKDYLIQRAAHAAEVLNAKYPAATA